MRFHFRAFTTRPDVVVVGAGPTGLLMSALLGALDVSVHVLEKRRTLPEHPQAHFINHRSMEIFRPLDGLAEEITRKTPPLNEWRTFIYSETVKGGRYGKVDHFAGQPSVSTLLSPEPVAHLSQNKLLPMILDRAMRNANVRIEFGQEVIRCSSTKQGASVTVRTESGIREIASKACVIANGANSELVHQQGIACQGTGVIQNVLSVHFHSRQLSELIAADPGMLYFVFNSDVVLVIVVHNLEEGEFVAQIPFFPPLQRPSDFGNERCDALLNAAAGTRLSDIHIRSVRPWMMKAQVADSFQRGNLFLIGDAGHVFPPAGGFGMNTGIQDAHNLCWKLAAVIKKWNPGELLDTYTKERHPIAMQNSVLSVENWKEAAAVPAAIGLDPRNAAFLNAAISGPVSRFLPQSLAKAVLETALDVGRRLSGNRGPLKFWRKKRLQEIFTSKRSLRLQFLKEDIGFVYAVRPQTQGTVSDTSTPESRSRLDPFFSSLVQGGRLPHSTIRLTTGKLVSMLDLVAWSKLRSTVFFLGIERHICLSLLEDLADTKAASLIIGVRICTSTETTRSQTSASSQEDYLPFPEPTTADASHALLPSGIQMFEGVPVSGLFTERCRKNEQLTIVVRPDGHIDSILSSPSSQRLRQAIQHIYYIDPVAP